MNSTTPFYHLAAHGLEKTVVESQVIAPALKLQELGLTPHILVLEDISNWLRLIVPSFRRRRKAQFKGLPHTLVPRIPRNFLYLNTLLIRLLIGGGPAVVQARGLQGAAMLLPLKMSNPALKIICDIRGLEAEEYAYAASQNGSLGWAQCWWKKCLDCLSQRAIKGSDVRFCVSSSMISYFKGQPSAQEPWEHIPCCVDVPRFKAALTERGDRRHAMGISDRIVVVYSGAVRLWQLPETLVETVKQMKLMNPAVFFLALTPDTDYLSGLLTKSGLSADDFHVRQVSFSEMPSYLAAGDIGLLLREEHVLNKHACPTKFGEYLASGLHVVATQAVDEISQVIQDRGVGTLVNLDDERRLRQQLEGALKSALDLRRIANSQSAAEAVYDWARYVPIIKKWYLQLASPS